MLPTLVLAFMVSILICVLAAARHSELTVALAAALFALQAIVVLVRINVPLWGAGTNPGRHVWAWDNSLLTAIAYAWGSAAMFTIYSLGGLVWRHWWQYGAGMLLLAASTLICARLLVGSGTTAPADGRALRTLMRVTMLQMAAVVAALVYLVASGKLATLKDDWAANQVFIAGGVTVLVISLVSLITWRRLGGAQQPAA